MASRIGVYMGSNNGTSPAFADAAEQLGAALARRGIGMVYGGGNVGLMGIAADAALAAGGEVIGVITEFLVGKEVAHPLLSELRITATMHERKEVIADLSDGFIALPGGFGTIDEIAEMLTWDQLGLQGKSIVFLDVDGYWGPLLAMFDCAVDGGFVRPAHRVLAQRAVSVEEAVALASAPVGDVPHKWMDRDAR
ncbi:MAG: TIGR00730 family Rossman fold protein [Acidimicrobiia bacterium]